MPVNLIDTGQGLTLFSQHQQRRRLRQGLRHALQLLLEGLDLSLVLGAEPFELFLLGYGQDWCGVGIGGGLTPAVYLLREQTPLPAVGTELGVVEASGLKHHRELVSSAPAFWLLLGCGHRLCLQTPGLPPDVEGDHMDAHLLGNPGHALPLWRAHSPLDISFDGLAATRH